MTHLELGVRIFGAAVLVAFLVGFISTWAINRLAPWISRRRRGMR